MKKSVVQIILKMHFNSGDMCTHKAYQNAKITAAEIAPHD